MDYGIALRYDSVLSPTHGDTRSAAIVPLTHLPGTLFPECVARVPGSLWGPGG